MRQLLSLSSRARELQRRSPHTQLPRPEYSELTLHSKRGRRRDARAPRLKKSQSSSENPAQLSAVSLSRVRLFATPWTAACQASLSITNSRSLLRLTSIESVLPKKKKINFFKKVEFPWWLKR